MKFYKHTKQKLKYLWWLFIYSKKLGVPGIRVKLNSYKDTPIIIPYKYILRIIAHYIATTKIKYGTKNLLINTSVSWNNDKNNINISPISKELLAHLFYKLQYNDKYILEHIKYDRYYKELYNKKIIELEAV